ncbi:hypothetical protein ABZ863_26060 [Saccharomonospora sp. NPDC046836]|uniref:hypothetical protein n=1 Tax=Saccharomonospora sp. NPDC046836 TaxID=3156921 RepID=UPI0033C19B59
MGKSKVVQYRVRPEVADENQRLVENVVAEFAAENPDGMRYAVFRLADGVSFVHIVHFDIDDNGLSRSAAFAEFQRGFGDRVIGEPTADEATLIGSYRFAGTAVSAHE